MKKIDWMRKLTSRKLWLSVASFVTLMVVACGGTENEAAQISAESETDKKLNMLSNVIDQYYLYGDDIDEKKTF